MDSTGKPVESLGYLHRCEAAAKIMLQKAKAFLSGTSTEQQMLKFVIQHAKQGDVNSVVTTIDDYAWQNRWMMNVGDEKGALLDTIFKEVNPKTALELGSYSGYSACRQGRWLKEGGKLITIEFNPANADVAEKIIEYAGMTGKVKLIRGDTKDVIPQLKSKHGVDTFDFVFIDHWKDVYLRDIKLLEEHDLLRKGSVIVADNVVFPGAPDYLAYVRNTPRYKSFFYEAHLEYTKNMKDGLEKSIFQGKDKK